MFYVYMLWTFYVRFTYPHHGHVTPGAMDDRDGWRERVMEIRADSATGRMIYIQMCESKWLMLNCTCNIVIFDIIELYKLYLLKCTCNIVIFDIIELYKLYLLNCTCNIVIFDIIELYKNKIKWAKTRLKMLSTKCVYKSWIFNTSA